MRVIVSIFAIVFLFTAVFVSADEAKKEEKAEKAKYDFIGADKCKMCHKKDGTHPSWLKTKHAYAYDSLSAEDQKNKELQKYYTTGKTAKGDLLAGVQCEACHGPGSAYKKMSIMKDREKAIANGLLIPDENTCKTCHYEKAPKALAALGKEFDFEKMKAKGIHDIRTKKETATEKGKQ